MAERQSARPRRRLPPRPIFASVVALLAAALFLAWFGDRLIDEGLQRQIAGRVAAVDAVLDAALAPAVSRSRADEAQPALDLPGDERAIRYIVVFDRSGRILAKRNWDDTRPLPPGDAPDSFPGDGTYNRNLTLVHDARPAGSVRYGLALDDILETGAATRRLGAWGLAAATSLALAVLLYFGLRLARELDRIRDAARRLAGGDLGFRLPDSGRGDLAGLGQDLNTVAQSLASRIDAARANEDRLALVIEATSDGIWELDPASGERYYSPRYRQLLGYADERAFRLRFKDDSALHPDDRDRVVEARRRLLAAQEDFDQEYRLEGADGRYRWFHGRARAVRSRDGQAIKLLGSIADIDDRRTAQDALHRSEARFQHVVQGATDGIWDWDLPQRRYYISPQLKSLLGYADAELPNERASFFHVIHPADLDRVRGEIADHFAHRKGFDTELRLRHKDGTVGWYRVRGQAIWDDAGNVCRFAGACTGIRAQKQAEERIRDLLAEKQVLIDNLQVGIAFVRSGAIASTNRRMEDLFGHSAAGLLGTAPGALFRRADEYNSLRTDLESRGGGRSPLSRDLELQRADGTVFWGLVTGQPIDAAHPERGEIWIFFDTTEHRHAVDSLRNERDFSDSLINGMPGIFYLVDREGRFLRWNRNLETVTGYDSRNLAEIRAIELFAEEDRPALAEATYRTLKFGENQRELVLRTRDGERIPFLMSGVRFEVDGMTHIMGIGFDIGPRLAAEERARSLNDELEQRVHARTVELAAANKELESFSYSVSHDLSAPLRGIDGFSRMLAEDFGALLPELGRSYITRIRAATQRMQQLIDDLLRLSRVTRDELHRETLDMSAVAQEIVEELRASSPARLVEVTIAPNLRVHADRNLVRIALSNLLRNAWKFTSRRQKATIHFGELREQDQTVYFVKDDGAGFDMRYAGRLFGAFHRLHRSSEFEGTGIGLAIVSRIVLRHGGRIWAEAGIDQGATFYFTLGLGAHNGHGAADPAG